MLGETGQASLRILSIINRKFSPSLENLVFLPVKFDP